jgi:hypothetical protein
MTAAETKVVLAKVHCSQQIFGQVAYTEFLELDQKLSLPIVRVSGRWSFFSPKSPRSLSLSRTDRPCCG